MSQAAPFIEGEVFVGAEIVNRELVCLWLFSCGLAVEEENVGLHALRVEDARGQTQQCVDVGFSLLDGAVSQKGLAFSSGPMNNLSMSSESYSKNLDTIIALTSNLALVKYKSRTPSNLAKYLNFEKKDVEHVLETFKGLFRRSINKSPGGEYYYTLQLRFAKRWIEDETVDNEEAEIKEPLGADYLQALFTLISSRATQEVELQKTKLQSTLAFVGSWDRCDCGYRRRDHLAL
jgi:hypothetical protein